MSRGARTIVKTKESMSGLLSDNIDYSIIVNKNDKLIEQLKKCFKLLDIICKLFNIGQDLEKFIQLNNKIIDLIVANKTYKINMFGLPEQDPNNIKHIKLIYESLMNSTPLQNLLTLCRNLKLYVEHFCVVNVKETPGKFGKSIKATEITLREFKDSSLSQEENAKREITACKRLFHAVKGSFDVFNFKDMPTDGAFRASPLEAKSSKFLGESEIMTYNVVIENLKRFDFHSIYNNAEPAQYKNIMSSLGKLYKNSYDAYKIMCIPDIDVGQIKSMVEQGMTDAEKDRQLSRCKDALRTIKNSVGLLDEQIDRYYIHYMQTANVNIIIEDYISDLLEINKDNQALDSQLKVLMGYFRKKASEKIGMIKDPKIKAQLGGLVGVLTSSMQSADHSDLQDFKAVTDGMNKTTMFEDDEDVPELVNPENVETFTRDSQAGPSSAAVPGQEHDQEQKHEHGDIDFIPDQEDFVIIAPVDDII